MARSQRNELTAALDRIPQQRRYLFWFTYAAGLVSLQILYLALDDMAMNLSLTAALTAGFIYSYYLDPRFRPLTIYWVSAFSLAVSVAYYMRIQADPWLLGNYLGILAGVLVALLAFKAFAPGDHRFILMFCVVFLLFSSAASYDLKYMLLLPLFLLAAGGSLYVSSQIETAMRVAQTGGGELPPVVTLSRAFYRVLWRAVLGIIGLSIVAYVLTPHQARGDRSLIFNSASTVTPESDEGMGGEIQQAKLERINSSEVEVGIGNDFDLTDPRRLSSEPRPVLQMKSHRNGYLRAQIYDYYTGSAWIRSPRMVGTTIPLTQNESSSVLHFERDNMVPANTSFFIPLIDFPSKPTANRLTGIKSGRRGEAAVYTGNVYSTDSQIELGIESIRQEITLLEPQPPHYYSMFQPSRLQNVSLNQSGGMVNVPEVDLGSTVRPRNVDQWHPQGFSYTVHSVEPRFTTRDLAKVVFRGPEQIVQPYTQVPQGNAPDEEGLEEVRSSWRPISQRMRNFATQIGAERVPQGTETITPYQRVGAIYEFLTSNEFTYTREYQTHVSAKELTEAFCFDTKEGYCRHFASAMAVLCRLNDVPARVVSGFAPGNYSLIDNAYIYRASDAHAWVEVYFDGYGWVMFDPSPASGDVFNTSDLLRVAMGTLDFMQQLFVLDPAATQQVILASLRQLLLTIISYGPAAIALLAFTVLGALLALRWSRLPRRLRRESFVPANGVVAAYVAVREQLTQVGLPPKPGDTARTFLNRAAQSADGAGDPLRMLIPLYERAAFAPATVEEDEVEQANGIVAQVRQWVAAELQRRRQQRRR